MTVQNEFKQLCGKMSEEMMKPFMAQKENIYIDADLLYDYRLGAVMALIQGEEDYNYVMQHVQEYLDAPTLECAKFFPKLGLTEQKLDEVIADPKYFVFISAAAPATQLLGEDLETLIRLFNTINQSKEVTRPLHLTINQRHIKIHEVYKKAIRERIWKVDPSVVIDFTEYKTWADVPERTIECQDFLGVYDMIEFLREGTNSQKLISAVPPRLTRCNICTLLQSDHDNPTADEFHNLRLMMECMCAQFTFKPKTLLNEELRNG